MSDLAIIINGDNYQDPKKHSINVRQMIDRQKEAGAEIYLFGTERPPDIDEDHFILATRANVLRMAEMLAGETNRDRNLTIHVTGHTQSLHGGSIGLVDHDHITHDEFFAAADSFQHRERLFLIDGCYGGALAARFAEDPWTLAVSASSDHETTNCRTFIERFLAPDSEVEDLNNDQVISLGERYAYTLEVQQPARTEFFLGRNFIDDGFRNDPEAIPPFPRKVIEAHSKEELEQLRATLKPGQIMVVDFTVEQGCEPCKKFDPIFDQMPSRDNGHRLYVKAVAPSLNTNDWFQDYGITATPTVALINNRGEVVVTNSHYPLRNLALSAHPQTLRPRFEALLQRPNDPYTSDAVVHLVNIHPKLVQGEADIAAIVRHFQTPENGKMEFPDAFWMTMQSVAQHSPELFSGGMLVDLLEIEAEHDPDIKEKYRFIKKLLAKNPKLLEDPGIESAVRSVIADVRNKVGDIISPYVRQLLGEPQFNFAIGWNNWLWFPEDDHGAFQPELSIYYGNIYQLSLSAVLQLDFTKDSLQGIIVQLGGVAGCQLNGLRLRDPSGNVSVHLPSYYIEAGAGYIATVQGEENWADPFLLRAGAGLLFEVPSPLNGLVFGLRANFHPFNTKRTNYGLNMGFVF